VSYYPNQPISATWHQSPATLKKLIMNTRPRSGTLSVRVPTAARIARPSMNVSAHQPA